MYNYITQGYEDGNYQDLKRIVCEIWNLYGEKGIIHA